MSHFILILSLFGIITLSAQSPETPVPTDPDTPKTDDGVRVAVLGYHDFSSTLPETEMRIHTEKFRKQMELIRQMGISVISLDQFTAWKRGESTIPEKSMLITLDDGWKSVYTDAFPILKEFSYPFTLYLYKNYVDGGGKALTTPMIHEMLEAGATLGSHSVSHPYPITFKSHQKKGPDDYDSFLRKELGESKRFLESKFKIKADTYSYPGGYVTAEMLPLIREFGYTHAFTVLPAKVQQSTPDHEIPRYMILGNYDKIFEFATSFESADTPLALPSGAIAGLIQTTDFPVSPEPGAIINSRLPVITADLSNLENLDPSTLAMQVSGFAKVPATFNPESKIFSWTVNRRLRHSTCKVVVSWKTLDGQVTEKPLRWSFQIDRDAAYLLPED